MTLRSRKAVQEIDAPAFIARLTDQKQVFHKAAQRYTHGSRDDSPCSNSDDNAEISSADWQACGPEVPLLRPPRARAVRHPEPQTTVCRRTRCARITSL